MQYPTLSEMRDKVRTDLDLIDEPGITDAEINTYLREGVDVAEAAIHSLYEDYFKTEDYLELISGQSQYDMPSNIYAQKIRAIIYHNGPLIYEIVRFERKLNEFERIQRGKEFSTSDWYMYYTTNPSFDKPKINLVPVAAESSTQNVVITYIRNANPLDNDDDVCDIPEFMNFIIAYAKNEISVNKPGLVPNPQAIAGKVEALYEAMIDALSNKSPDQNDIIDMDLSHYEEHA